MPIKHSHLGHISQWLSGSKNFCPWWLRVVSSWSSKTACALVVDTQEQMTVVKGAIQTIYATSFSVTVKKNKGYSTVLNVYPNDWTCGMMCGPAQIGCLASTTKPSQAKQAITTFVSPFPTDNSQQSNCGAQRPSHSLASPKHCGSGRKDVRIWTSQHTQVCICKWIIVIITTDITAKKKVRCNIYFFAFKMSISPCVF